MGAGILIVLLAVGLSLAMAAAWAVARRPGKSGWTDAAWSFAIGVGGVIAALAPIHGVAAQPARQALVAVLVALWSLRLGLHIAARASRGHDDPRYAELRRQWGDGFDRRLFLFLQIQAAAALALDLSVLVAAHNPAPAWAWSDGVGALLLIVAIVGEGAADRQLKSFARNPANKRRVCDVGLWGWSRHPNYFFEWLGWVAHPVIAIGPAAAWGWGWAAVTAPLFIYWLLVHVSGIPPLEEHMLRSRGDAFKAYQARVSAFWPAPPRNSRHSPGGPS